jgi:hypothetical protein
MRTSFSHKQRAHADVAAGHAAPVLRERGGRVAVPRRAGPDEQAGLRPRLRAEAGVAAQFRVGEQGYPRALRDAVHDDVPVPRFLEHRLERVGPFDARDLDPVLAVVTESQRR